MSDPYQEFVCIYCGRRGTRDFIIVSGKAGEAPTQLRCANSKACERRQQAAIRREARRGNWS